MKEFAFRTVLATAIFAAATPVTAKEPKPPRSIYTTAKTVVEVRDCMVDRMGIGQFGAVVTPRGENGNYRVGRAGMPIPQHVDIEATPEGTSVKVYGDLSARALDKSARKCL